jgi:hypothetical protein
MTLWPFFFQINVGLEPAFVALAVKVVGTPWQMGLEEVVTLTAGVTEGCTVTVLLDIGEVAQGE